VGSEMCIRDSIRTFIRCQSAPAQAVHDIILGARHETGLIRVFYAQDEVAALLAGKQIIIEYRAYTSQMKSACGTWGEADPYFLGIHAAKIGKKGQGNGGRLWLKGNSRYLWACSI
jgi:hypothetical protein